ncbi:RING finger protein [Trichinella pseudospiralis]|uniref:RING finger protein n=1 Tax=Trichinella pseudospiralis TaxID=6337 RepID=A0A0V1IQ35_TRIPS|nr:RING finger protein [Trichinella pseudospiralis]
MEDDQTSKQGVVFKKRTSSRQHGASIRKRYGNDDSSNDEEESCVFSMIKQRKTNPMVQSTLKDNAKPEKQRDLSAVKFSYASSPLEERAGPSDMGATLTDQTETERDKDARAQFERAQKLQKDRKIKGDDKLYQGINAYGGYIEKKDSAAGNAFSGPLRAPDFVRRSVRWDYRPDICKDYKETGFCGFGGNFLFIPNIIVVSDSCIFLHDRSDYKHGWELERDWEKGRYGKDDEDVHKYEISDEEEELPFKCLICRNSFTDPVVTKLGNKHNKEQNVSDSEGLDAEDVVEAEDVAKPTDSNSESEHSEHDDSEEDE